MDRDKTLEQSHGSDESVLPPPRLGIVHLLLWIGVTAVLLKIDAAIVFLAGTRGEMFFQALVAVHAAWMSAGMIGLAVLLRWQGRLGPGHWLLVAIVPASLVVLLFGLGDYWLTVSWRLHARQFYVVPMGIVFGMAEIVRAASLLFAAFRLQGQRRWQRCLLLLGGVSGGMGIVQSCSFVVFPRVFLMHAQTYLFYSTLLSVGAVIGTVLLLPMAICDGIKFRRDWLHWLGIASFVGRGLMSMAYLVWTWFL